MKEKRYRTFEIILYNDNEVHLELIKYIRAHYQYALILHNKDYIDNGSLKKCHYHVIIYYENAKTESAVRNYFVKNGLIDNPLLINFKSDLKSSVRYLTHIDNNEKAKYNVEDIECNFDISSYFNNLISNETLDIQLIRKIIFSYNCVLSKTELFEEIINNNLWSTYRRNYSIIKDMLEERNALYNRIKN